METKKTKYMETYFCNANMGMKYFQTLALFSTELMLAKLVSWYNSLLTGHDHNFLHGFVDACLILI